MKHENLRLTGYIRDGQHKVKAYQQKKLIVEYCERHHHHLVGIWEDNDQPSLGLAQAMSALTDCDGLIASDLNQFVQHSEDRLLDLRPLVDRLFEDKKVLITVLDGIETQTAAGQELVFELISNRSDSESLVGITRHV